MEYAESIENFTFLFMLIQSNTQFCELGDIMYESSGPRFDKEATFRALGIWSVVQAVNGLVEKLRIERKRVPGEVLVEADRRECPFSLGYNPHFDGDEPPDL